MTIDQVFSKHKKQILENKFNKMNAMQKEAIFSINGPLLILAGAGSGKTTVIVNRIAYMLKYGNVYTDNKVDNLSLLSKCSIFFISKYDGVFL